MFSALEFVRWALTHVQKDSVPEGAALASSDALCALDPWQYLFGSIMVKTTPANLDYFYNEHYADEMTRTEFDSVTANWSPNGYATDCQGLLDAWLTYEMDEPTDVNVNHNWLYWCTDKYRIDEISRPYLIGEAVFSANSAGRMTHVGWICGSVLGEPLVVEARGIRYGVTISRLSERSFTHRGLMTKLFEYDGGRAVEPIRLELKSPMIRGDAILALQFALNGLGYTDADGKPLTEDGKCGRRTLYAVDKFVEIQSGGTAVKFVLHSEDGEKVLRMIVEKP